MGDVHELSKLADDSVLRSPEAGSGWDEPLQLDHFEPPPFPTDALPDWTQNFV